MCRVERALDCVQRRMAEGLLEAVRGLWLADPELGPKPLLAKLRPRTSSGLRRCILLRRRKPTSQLKRPSAAARQWPCRRIVLVLTQLGYGLV